MDQRVEFGKKAAAILDCNPPKLSTNKTKKAKRKQRKKENAVLLLLIT